MRKLYIDQIVDYNEGCTEFVEEFNQEIKETGAIAYNYSTNTYQYIHDFQEIEFINEIYPYYFKVEKSKLPNGIDIKMAYSFHPEDFEDDQEVTELWQQAKEEGLPYYEYDDNGEIYLDNVNELTTEPTRHTIWILNKEGCDYIESFDALAISPMIKFLNVAKEAIKEKTIKPFDD